MATFQKAGQLPHFDNDNYPRLPKRQTDDDFFLVKWTSPDYSCVVSVLVTICAHAGDWRPVNMDQVHSFFSSNPIHEFARVDYEKALGNLAKEKLVQLYAVGFERYVVVTPQLAKTALKKLEG